MHFKNTNICLKFNDQGSVTTHPYNWFGIEPLDSLIRHYSVLIIVGSGHLGGDSGLLKLLTDRNYTVRPV